MGSAPSMPKPCSLQGLRHDLYSRGLNTFLLTVSAVLVGLGLGYESLSQSAV